MPPGRTSGATPASSSRCSAGEPGRSSSGDGASAARDGGAACRGRSTARRPGPRRTRRAADGAWRRPPGRATLASPRRAASAAIRRTPPRCTSSATTRPPGAGQRAAGRLAAGRGAGVEHARAGREPSSAVTSCEASPWNAKRPARNAGSARSRPAAALERPAHRARSARAPHVRPPRPARAPSASRVARRRVHAHRRPAAGVVRRQQRGQLVDADLVGEALDQPAWVRPLDGEPVERIGRGIGRATRSRPSRAARRSTAFTRPAAPRPLPTREPHAGVDRGVRRHAIEEQRAGRGPSRSAARTGGSSRASGPRTSRRQVMVQPALPREGAVDQLGGERAIGAAQGCRGARRAARRRTRLSSRRARGRRARRRARRARASPAEACSRRQAVAGEERRRIEPPLALELHVEQPQRAVARRDVDAAWRRGDTVPGVAGSAPRARAPRGAPSAACRRALVNAAGAGCIARTRRSSSTAGRAHTSRACVRSMRGANVTPAAGCGVAWSVPSRRPSMASPIASPPSAARRAVSVPVVSSGRIGVSRTRSTSPASISSLIAMMLTPVTASPAMMA